MTKPSSEEIEKAVEVLVHTFAAVVSENMGMDLPPEGEKSIAEFFRGVALNGWVIAVHEYEERVRSLTCGAIAEEDFEAIQAALTQLVSDPYDDETKTVH